MAGAGEGTNEIEREGGEGAGGKEREGGEVRRVAAPHRPMSPPCRPCRTRRRAPHIPRPHRPCPAPLHVISRMPRPHWHHCAIAWGSTAVLGSRQAQLARTRPYARSTCKCCLGCKGCLGCMGAGTGDCCSDLRAGWLVAAAKFTASVSHSKRLAQVVGRPRNNRSEHRPAD